MIAEQKLSHTAALILGAIHAGDGYGFSVMEMTGLPSGTVYPAMRRLERDGLISLEQDATDRRRRHVKLTRTGRSRFAAAQPLWDRAQARFEDSFGKQQAAELRAVLVKIARIRSLGRDGAAPSL